MDLQFYNKGENVIKSSFEAALHTEGTILE